MNAATTPYPDPQFEPHAPRRRALAVTVSMLCYASLLLALYASSQLLG
jgi:hypothetical protein